MKHGRLYLYPIGNVDRAWSPFTIGTYKDAEEAGILLSERMKLQFYDEDAHAQGNPDDLLFLGTAHLVEGKGLGAIIDATTSRWESDKRKLQESEPES